MAAVLAATDAFDPHLHLHKEEGGVLAPKLPDQNHPASTQNGWQSHAPKGDADAAFVLSRDAADLWFGQAGLLSA
jgi:hypothetical protein